MEEEATPLTPSLNTKPAPSFSPPKSSIPRNIRKAICFLLKNMKLMLQLFILSFFPFLILVLLHTLIALPLIGRVEDGFEKSAIDLQDLIFLVIMEIPFAFAFCLLLLFASAITIFAASHQSASLGLEETLLSIKSTWKRVLVSGLYASFLKIAFVVVAVILTQLTALVPVMAALTFPCLASICSLVLVISTVDDECQGKMAVSRAREVAGQGRFLMLMLELLSVPAYVLFYVTATDDDNDDANGMITQSGFMSVAAALVCLTNIYKDVVCTLFYLDYKQRNGIEIKELVSFSANRPEV